MGRKVGDTFAYMAIDNFLHLKVIGFLIGLNDEIIHHLERTTMNVDQIKNSKTSEQLRLGGAQFERRVTIKS